MSIDARVDYVEFSEGRSGCLHLIDRPAREGVTGGMPGIRGQAAAYPSAGAARAAEPYPLTATDVVPPL